MHYNKELIFKCIRVLRSQDLPSLQADQDYPCLRPRPETTVLDSPDDKRAGTEVRAREKRHFRSLSRRTLNFATSFATLKTSHRLNRLHHRINMTLAVGKNMTALTLAVWKNRTTMTRAVGKNMTTLTLAVGKNRTTMTRAVGKKMYRSLQYPPIHAVLSANGALSLPQKLPLQNLP